MRMGSKKIFLVLGVSFGVMCSGATNPRPLQADTAVRLLMKSAEKTGCQIKMAELFVKGPVRLESRRGSNSWLI